MTILSKQKSYLKKYKKNNDDCDKNDVTENINNNGSRYIESLINKTKNEIQNKSKKNLHQYSDEKLSKNSYEYKEIYNKNDATNMTKLADKLFNGDKYLPRQKHMNIENNSRRQKNKILPKNNQQGQVLTCQVTSNLSKNSSIEKFQRRPSLTNYNSLITNLHQPDNTISSINKDSQSRFLLKRRDFEKNISMDYNQNLRNGDHSFDQKDLNNNSSSNSQIFYQSKLEISRKSTKTFTSQEKPTSVLKTDIDGTTIGYADYLKRDLCSIGSNRYPNRRQIFGDTGSSIGPVLGANYDIDFYGNQNNQNDQISNKSGSNSYYNGKQFNKESLMNVYKDIKVKSGLNSGTIDFAERADSNSAKIEAFRSYKEVIKQRNSLGNLKDFGF